jgi:hypothetical protein
MTLKRMSQSSSQAWAFYREVAATRSLWTIRDEGGFPAPIDFTGKRSQPFWSSRSRVERIIKSVPAYHGFEPYEISWDDFCSKWVPGLATDGLLVGVNWSGEQATGYDIEPEQVQQCVQTMIDEPRARSPSGRG